MATSLKSNTILVLYTDENAVYNLFPTKSLWYLKVNVQANPEYDLMSLQYDGVIAADEGVHPRFLYEARSLLVNPSPYCNPKG